MEIFPFIFSVFLPFPPFFGSFYPPSGLPLPSALFGGPNFPVLYVHSLFSFPAPFSPSRKMKNFFITIPADFIRFSRRLKKSGAVPPFPGQAGPERHTAAHCGAPDLRMGRIPVPVIFPGSRQMLRSRWLFSGPVLPRENCLQPLCTGREEAGKGNPSPVPCTALSLRKSLIFRSCRNALAASQTQQHPRRDASCTSFFKLHRIGTAGIGPDAAFLSSPVLRIQKSAP